MSNLPTMTVCLNFAGDCAIFSPLINSAFSDSRTVSMKWVRRLVVQQVAETLHYAWQARGIDQLLQQRRIKLRDGHGNPSSMARL